MKGPRSSRADAYASVIALLPEAALIVTVEGAIHVANARAADMLGVPLAGAAGRSLGEFVEEPAKLAEFLRLAARSAIPLPAGMRLVHQTDSDCRLDGAVLATGSKEGPALILIRMRPKEAAINRFLALNLRIEELGREVARRQRAESALAEADRRKDEFLAMLAHELRNPLAVLSNGIAYMAASRDAQPKAGEDMVAPMQRQLRQLSRLVDDLLDVARISTGKMVMRREARPLRAVLEDALDTCRPAITARGVDVVATLPDEPAWVEADPARLPQVFCNLISNAVKFSDPGSSVRISCELDGGKAVVRVHDAGAGIRRELLHSVFDLFTQADQSLARSQGGLGVGLSVAKRITELHGGTIEAHSEGEGLGSEFRVTLPLAAPLAAAQPAQQQKAPQPTSAKRRILVVDDNEDAASSLAALLRLSGHEVQVSYDGESALRLSGAMLPDIVVLDLGMPGMNGYEVARRLRQSAAAKLPRIIALSGYGAEADRIESRRAGFDHHLTKPVQLETLQGLIN